MESKHCCDIVQNQKKKGTTKFSETVVLPIDIGDWNKCILRHCAFEVDENDWLTKGLEYEKWNCIKKNLCGLVDAVDNKRMEEYWKNRELKVSFAKNHCQKIHWKFECFFPVFENLFTFVNSFKLCQIHKKKERSVDFQNPRFWFQFKAFKSTHRDWVNFVHRNTEQINFLKLGTHQRLKQKHFW